MSTVEHQSAVKKVRPIIKKEGETNKSELSSSSALTNTLSLSSSSGNKNTKDSRNAQSPESTHIASILGIPVMSASSGAHVYRPTSYPLSSEEKSSSEPLKTLVDAPSPSKAASSEGLSAGFSLFAALAAGTPGSTFPKKELPSDKADKTNNTSSAVLPSSMSTSNATSGAPTSTELQTVDSRSFSANDVKKGVQHEKNSIKKKQTSSIQGEASRLGPKKETQPSRKAPAKKTSSTLPGTSTTVRNVEEKASLVVPTSSEGPSPSASAATTAAIPALAEAPLLFAAPPPSASGMRTNRAEASESQVPTVLPSTSTTTAPLSSASPSGKDSPTKNAEARRPPLPAQDKKIKVTGPAASNGKSSSIALTKKLDGPAGNIRHPTTENSKKATKRMSSTLLPTEDSAKNTTGTTTTTVPTATLTTSTASARLSGNPSAFTFSSPNGVPNCVDASVHNGEKDAKDNHRTRGEGSPLLFHPSSAPPSSATSVRDMAAVGSKTVPTKAAVANASTPNVNDVGVCQGTVPPIPKEDHTRSGEDFLLHSLQRDTMLQGKANVQHILSSAELHGEASTGRNPNALSRLGDTVERTVGKTREAHEKDIPDGRLTAQGTKALGTPSPTVQMAGKETENGGGGGPHRKEEKGEDASPAGPMGNPTTVPFLAPRYHHVLSQSPPIASRVCSPPSLPVPPSDPAPPRDASIVGMPGRGKAEEDTDVWRVHSWEKMAHTKDEERNQRRSGAAVPSHATEDLSPFSPAPEGRHSTDGRGGMGGMRAPRSPHRGTPSDRAKPMGKRSTTPPPPPPSHAGSMPVRDEDGKRTAAERPTGGGRGGRSGVALGDWENLLQALEEGGGGVPAETKGGTPTHAAAAASASLAPPRRPLLTSPPEGLPRHSAPTATAMPASRSMAPSSTMEPSLDVATSFVSFRHSPYGAPTGAVADAFPAQRPNGAGSPSAAAAEEAAETKGADRPPSPTPGQTTLAALFGAWSAGTLGLSSPPHPSGSPVVSQASASAAVGNATSSPTASSHADAATPDLRGTPGRAIPLSSLFPSDPVRSGGEGGAHAAPPPASVLPLIGATAPSSVHGPKGNRAKQRRIAAWVAERLPVFPPLPPSSSEDLDSYFVQNNFLLTAFEKTAEEESLGYRVPIDNVGATSPIIRTLPYLYPPSKDGVSGGRLVIVGDVHGCAEQLEALLQKIRFDVQVDRLVMVGDLVNKGPDSMGVVRVCQKYKAVGTLGNHDMTLLDLCAENRRRAFPHAALKDPVKRIALSFPLDCELYLRQMPHIIRIPQYNVVVVHAGIDPRRGLDEQTVYNVLHMRRLAWNDAGRADDDGEERGGDSPPLEAPCGTVDGQGCASASMTPMAHANTPVSSTAFSFAMPSSLSASPLQSAAPLPSTPTPTTTTTTTRSGKEGCSAPSSVEDGVIVKGEEGVLWGKLYNGPETIIFGHAAQSSYQQHPFALGLDTGCVYGNALTCVIFSPMSKTGVFAAVQGWQRKKKHEHHNGGSEPKDACEQHLLLPAEAVERSIARPMSRMSPAMGTPFSWSVHSGGGGSEAVVFPASSRVGKHEAVTGVGEGNAASPLSYPTVGSIRCTPSERPFSAGKSEATSCLATHAPPSRPLGVAPGGSPFGSFTYNPDAANGERCTPVSLFASPSTSSVGSALGPVSHFSPLQERKHTLARCSPLGGNHRERGTGSSAAASTSFHTDGKMLSRPPITMTPSSLSSMLQQRMEFADEPLFPASPSLDFPRRRQDPNCGNAPYSLFPSTASPVAAKGDGSGGSPSTRPPIGGGGGTPFQTTDTSCNNTIASASNVSQRKSSPAASPSSSSCRMKAVVSSTLLTLAAHQQYGAVARLLDTPHYDEVLDQLLDDACEEDAEEKKREGREKEGSVGDTTKTNDSVSSSIVSRFWIPLLETLLLVRPSPDASSSSSALESAPSKTSTNSDSFTSIKDVTELLLFALHACDTVSTLRKRLLPSLSLLASATTKEENETRTKEMGNDRERNDNNIFLPQNVVKYAQMLLKE